MTDDMRSFPKWFVIEAANEIDYVLVGPSSLPKDGVFGAIKQAGSLAYCLQCARRNNSGDDESPLRRPNGKAIVLKSE